MVPFSLPFFSRVQPGKIYLEPLLENFKGSLKGSKEPLQKNLRTFQIYRWQPSEKGEQALPRYDQFQLDTNRCGPMVLDALITIKSYVDTSLTFRRSCREGVCGSCAMNIDGVNTLACIQPLAEIKGTIKINHLPHMPVIKDLVPDLRHAHDQYASIQPWLQSDLPKDLKKEQQQTPQQRAQLEGLWECILCFCCSTACPSYWWNGDQYLGPATLLQSLRWIEDSRDQERSRRLKDLNDEMKLYRCHTIMNCAKTCPKGLNPAKAIAKIKSSLAKE